jgi:hypothetical protein
VQLEITKEFKKYSLTFTFFGVFIVEKMDRVSRMLNGVVAGIFKYQLKLRNSIGFDVIYY